MRRSPFALAVAAVVIAAAALTVGVVALARDDGTRTSAVTTGHTGMDMSSGQGMAEHMAPAPSAGVPNATAARGGTVLRPRVQGGVWAYELTARPVEWPILPGVRVTAWTYNGLLPGPELRIPYGQRVRVAVRNQLPQPTTVHWHGLAVPNAADGVPDVTQKPIQPGASYTYSFRAIPAGRNSKGGTFFYHSHYEEDRQVGLGLSGALVIEPPAAERYDVERTLMLAEWNLDPATGATRPPMEIEGVLPSYFTINGKSYPATDSLHVRPGQRVLLRLVGAGQFVHPMHLHGTSVTIVAKDGHPLGMPETADVVQVASGERYDIVFRATERGTWIFHCHIGHHLTNKGESPGGLLMVIHVGSTDKPAPANPPAPTTTVAMQHKMPDGHMMDGSSMSPMTGEADGMMGGDG
jgi:FtsP/CotA-like multicopper oxidase with cupredoxin domain